MTTISTALRNFKEPTKEELTQLFFSISPSENGATSVEKSRSQDTDKMDINAVLSLGEVEDSYVSGR